MASIPWPTGRNSLAGAGLDGTIVRFPKNSRVGGNISSSTLNTLPARNFSRLELPDGVNSVSSILLSSPIGAFTIVEPSPIDTTFDWRKRVRKVHSMPLRAHSKHRVPPEHLVLLARHASQEMAIRVWLPSCKPEWRRSRSLGANISWPCAVAGPR